MGIADSCDADWEVWRRWGGMEAGWGFGREMGEVMGCGVGGVDVVV